MKTNIKNIFSSALSLMFILTACGKSAFDYKKAAVIAGAPSAANSTMSVTEPNYADGSSPANITLTIRDANNEPVPNVTMSITVSGEQNVVVPCTTTNALGISSCRIYTTVSQWKAVSATGVIVLTQNVQFLPPKPMVTLMSVDAAGNITQAAGGELMIYSTGLIESPVAINDTFGKLRLYSSVLSIITE